MVILIGIPAVIGVLICGAVAATILSNKANPTALEYCGAIAIGAVAGVAAYFAAELGLFLWIMRDFH